MQLGVELTLLVRALSYESLDEAFDDLRSLAALPGKAAGVFGGAASNGAEPQQSAGESKA
jgi:hypothetical protein